MPPIDYDFDRRTLLLMVGLPYAGKTTKARQLSRALEAPIVSPDAIRVALSGHRFLAPLEPTVWWLARMMVRALFLAGHRTVIVDATNNTRKRRDEWRSSEGWEVVCVPVVEDLETIRRRAQDDDVIQSVINRMATEHEAPDPKQEEVATSERLLELSWAYRAPPERSS